MKNFSASSNWTTIREEEKIETQESEIIDNRVVLSYLQNEISYFLTSDGKPLVFSDEEKAKEYTSKNNIENYEIDNFADFDFSDVELIEI